MDMPMLHTMWHYTNEKVMIIVIDSIIKYWFVSLHNFCYFQKTQRKIKELVKEAEKKQSEHPGSHDLVQSIYSLCLVIKTRMNFFKDNYKTGLNTPYYTPFNSIKQLTSFLCEAIYH